MNKSLISFILVLLFSFSAFECKAKVADLLPKPHVVSLKDGTHAFALHRSVRLSDPTGCLVLQYFLDNTGCTLSDEAIPCIRVELIDAIEGSYDYMIAGFENESYQLSVCKDEILIKAVTKTGVIRAAQTLVQLAEGYDENGEVPQIEPVEIKDWPAFKVRGWMQDVGRSFLSVRELKNEIELLSRFKVNVFHWHLTEKLAWRFEVKTFPQLTEAENMIRYKGQFYSQEECREIEAYAAERGVTVIPEIDMPGHSDVFTKTMGFDMQSTKGREALKKILVEVGNTFPNASYIHIGGDEVTIQDGFLEEMTSYVREKVGRKVVVWNKLVNKPVTAQIADMTQMWATSGTSISGLPNIDCRYNYTNHFDVYADLVGIYKSNIYYAQKGNPDLAGTISAAWNDTKLPTEEDIIRQNNQYANILASAERAWIGGGKQYIENGGTRLPNVGEEYEEFVDFERRFLFHKAHSLSEQPIPYVKQTNVHWRITDPFPNGGDSEKVLPPEECSDTLLPKGFNYNGQYYGSSFVTGAGIYLRHIWHPTVPSFFSNPGNNQTAYAWTYVYSPKEQEVGAQIEFYTYSRSGSERAPLAGKWDRRGTRIWFNGEEIPAPKWEQPDQTIPQDDAIKGLRNENLTARPPVALHLKKGWNKVFMKLPHVNSGGTSRDKWQFTFVLTDLEGRNAIDNIIYSPDKSITDSVPINDDLPQLSTPMETYWYEFNTPKRNSLYPTSKGIGKAIVGEKTSSVASQWKFQKRTDGTFDIINRADSSYVSPMSEYNTALKTSRTQPLTGWTFQRGEVDGCFIITNGVVQFNQTDRQNQVYNWGGGTNTSDNGCQYAFRITKHELNDGTTEQPEQPVEDGRPKFSDENNIYWYRISSKRYANRFATSKGVGQYIIGEVENRTRQAEWKFVKRSDDSFDIVNRVDNVYISPNAANNTPLVLADASPTDGWKFVPTSTNSFFALVSNTIQINQTKAAEEFKLYNWGNGVNVTDEGCLFSFALTETEHMSTNVVSMPSIEAMVTVENGRIVCHLPHRIYSSDGRVCSLNRSLSPGIYIVQTAYGNVKVGVR